MKKLSLSIFVGMALCGPDLCRGAANTTRSHVRP